MYDARLYAGWGDMDFNSHMRNTAYLDKSADVRMMFFSENGFPMSEFARLRIGPVITRDEIDYFREVNLLDALRVTLAVRGLADDGSRFVLVNEFHRSDGRMAARVMSTGGWLDLNQRRLVTAPDALLAALRTLPKAEGFEVLPSSVR